MGSVATISNPTYTPHLEVKGNCSLAGRLKISGAKNSALVLMAASLLTEEMLEIKNIPSLSDVEVMGSILIKMGVKIKREANTLWINPKDLHHIALPKELVHRLRASFFCIGPLLAKLGQAKVPLPGGCQIGLRPIDEHIKGLRALGAEVDLIQDMITASIKNKKRRLTGANIFLNCPSVGATETLLMAASLAKGRTTIKNAAREPEIQDLGNMLNSMGAKIKGAGTSQITIDGVEKLKGCSHSAIPDRIEAGTFLIAAAITRSSLVIGPVIPDHLKIVLQKLKECGCKIKQQGDSIEIIPGNIHAINIRTNPFPGFPTDLQAPFMALMATAKGRSEITETIFENRMQHVGELQRMGAVIKVKESSAIIDGVAQLNATYLTGGDLRSSSALILASLTAQGTSRIEGLNHLDRGYENFEDKLNSIGANIVRHQNPIIQSNIISRELATQNNLTINPKAA